MAWSKWNVHLGVLLRCQKNDAAPWKRCLSRHQAMPSYIHRTIRQAAPGYQPLKGNVKRSCVFMLQHQWGYWFGISHPERFIELCTSRSLCHQGSAKSFGVPEATVQICYSQKLEFVQLLKRAPWNCCIFLPIYPTGAHVSVCRSKSILNRNF